MAANDDCIKFKKAYHRNAKVVMDNHPLMIMAREEQRNLLRHPLCMSLGMTFFCYICRPLSWGFFIQGGKAKFSGS